MHILSLNHRGDRHIPDQMTASELGKEYPVPEAQAVDEEPSILERLTCLEEQFKLFLEPTNHPTALCDFEDGIAAEVAKHGSEGDGTIVFENLPVEYSLEDDEHGPNKSAASQRIEELQQRNEKKRLLSRSREEPRGLRATQDQVEASVTDSKDQIIAELRNVIAEQESEKEQLMHSIAEVTADANSARNNADELSKAITWAMSQVENDDEMPWVGYEHWGTASRLLLHIRSLHETIDLLEESVTRQRHKASASQFKQQNAIQDLTTELTNTRLSKAIKSHEIKQLRNDIDEKDAKIADFDKRLRDQHEDHQNNTDELNKKIRVLQRRIETLEFEKIDSSISDEGWSGVLNGAAWPWEKPN